MQLFSEASSRVNLVYVHDLQSSECSLLFFKLRLSGVPIFFSQFYLEFIALFLVCIFRCRSYFVIHLRVVKVL